MDLNTINFYNIPENVFNARKPVRANIVFGNPKSKCKGTGICGVYTTESLNSNQIACAAKTAWLFATNEQTISFSFNKSDLCPGCIKKHFGTGYLILPVPVKIDTVIQAQLKIIKKHYLKSGKYRVVELREVLQVNVKI